MTKSTITRERLEWLSQISCRDDIEDIGGDEIRELASMALAAMDSDPVGWTDEQELRDVEKDGCGYLFKANPITLHADPRRVILLYRHAQPAPVVPEAKPIPNTLSMYAVDAVAAIAEVKGWNACRAAMLERQLVDRVDEKSLTSINPAPDLVSLQKKAESIIGNYPGIPDGYVMVPVEPNGDMLAAAQDAYGETDGDIASTLRAAMLSGGKS
ncbi:hypothetical protein [Klebsiella pneumoniae]